MEREELLKKTAQRYAAAQVILETAEREASRAKTEADNARIERDRVEKDLKEFVGRNQPRKLVLVDNGKAVLIQMDLRDVDHSAVYISVEKAL